MKLFFTRPIFLLTLLALLPLVYYWLRMPTSLTPSRSRGALWLRGLCLICLGLAMAGAGIVSSSKELTVIFLLDRSYSTGGNSQSWQRAFVDSAIAHKAKEDHYGVVVFGKDSGIEIPSGTHGSAEMGPLTTVVDQSASNLTTALRFAATAFPGDSARRLVLLTDAQSTEGGAEKEIRALSDAGIEPWLVPLPDDHNVDVLLSRFEAPAQIALNEPFLIRTVIESRGIESCELLITENGVPRQQLELKLREGVNLFLLPQRKTTSGPVRYEARLISDQDRRVENNKGEALSLVGGEQTVIVLRQEEGEGSLVPLLRQAGLNAQAMRPTQLPSAVGAWRDVSALIVEDVDSLDWNKRLQTVVNLLVREGGMGLMMAGSDSTFGVGAYQDTPIEPLLPVNLDIRRPKDQPLSALVQLIDKSGSMGGDPIRMAREAAIAAAETISEKDLVGVVGFDSAARWVVSLGPKGDGDALKRGVSTLRAGGGTDLYPALDEALDELKKTKAPLKHIIVLSDGAVAPGNYDKLLKRANEHRITVSAVAFGQGADIKFLEGLTKQGKGRLFRSEQTTAGSTLAQIFIRDTVLATGAGIQEKPTEVRATESGQTSPILAGLDLQGAPRLLAHNMASSKGGTAKTLLVTPKKDPILAIGRAGLGQSAAWLSDLGGDWAKGWDQTPGPGGELSLLETVLIRTVRAVVSSESLPLSARGNRLEVRASTTGDAGVLEINLSTRRPLKGPVKVVTISQSGQSSETILQPAGPFSATGTVASTEPGSGLVLAQTTEGEMLGRTNFTIPLAPEFTRLGTDRQKLQRWSQVPDGRFEPQAADIFSEPQRPVPIKTPLDHDLARGAFLLLLLEIAVRRLPTPKGRKQDPGKQKQKVEETRNRFSQLRAVKKSTRTARPEDSKPVAQIRVERLKKSEPSLAASPSEKVEPPLNSSENPESTLARLKKARKKK
ncbi:MAG: VWA domain-containing protein [Vulcanimicrobiota bacterium]